MGRISPIEEESVGKWVFHVHGIDVDTFEKNEIAEFRRGRRISSIELYFRARGADTGEVIAESREILDKFYLHLRNSRGFLI